MCQLLCVSHEPRLPPHGSHASLPFLLIEPQLTAPATITCRLNIENWSAGNNVGLNLSIFEASTSLEPAEPSEHTTEKDETQPLQSAGSDSAPAPPPLTARMLPSCTPSSALFSTNNGIYVIRPSGPSLQAVELGTGQYLLVPSTFEPTARRFVLDVHILSSAGGEGGGGDGGTAYRLTQLR
jgi:hypothetical protein